MAFMPDAAFLNWIFSGLCQQKNTPLYNNYYCFAVMVKQLMRTLFLKIPVK
jgi:hypothetical protein